jgi:hypothetical protein
MQSKYLILVDAAKSHEVTSIKPKASETPDIRTNMDEIELI